MMWRLDRRVVLMASVMLSTFAHLGFIAASPNIVLIGKDPTAHQLPERLRIRLIDETELRRFEAPPDKPGAGLATRPGAISDLLRAEQQPIEPQSNALAESVDVPGMEERVAADKLAALEPIAPAVDLSQHVDSRILEISQSVARDEVQIERRLVAPSDVRVLPEDASPVLRGTSLTISDELLMIDPLSGGGAGQGGAGEQSVPGTAASEPLAPTREQPVEDELETLLRDLPELPLEKVVARAPVVKEITENRRFDYLDDTVQMQLSTYIPPGEREGYFRLSIVPKEGEELEPLSKDVTFAIDASSSIQQRKLDEAARGVQRSINALRAQDRFNIVVFRDTPTLFQSDLVPATPENKRAAANFLKGLESRGETDVYAGIRPVIGQTPRDGVPAILFVISDGKPTAGIRDGRTLINALTDENGSRYTIYAYSGGRTVNQHLLDLLAYRNKGEAKVTPEIERMSSELPTFFSRLSDPILVDCDVDYGRIDEDSVYPREIPDFFRGQVVTVYGRFDPKRDREFAMRLTGRAGDSQKEVVFRADLQKAEKGDEAIARNWAFRKIYYLIGEVTRVGETPELLAQIRALAQQYNIRTSYD